MSSSLRLGVIAQRGSIGWPGPVLAGTVRPGYARWRIVGGILVSPGLCTPGRHQFGSALRPSNNRKVSDSVIFVAV